MRETRCHLPWVLVTWEPNMVIGNIPFVDDFPKFGTQFGTLHPCPRGIIYISVMELLMIPSVIKPLLMIMWLKQCHKRHHPPVITIFIGGITCYKRFPVMGG